MTVKAQKIISQYEHTSASCSCCWKIPSQINWATSISPFYYWYHPWNIEKAQLLLLQCSRYQLHQLLKYIKLKIHLHFWWFTYNITKMFNRQPRWTRYSTIISYLTFYMNPWWNILWSHLDYHMIHHHRK